MNWLTNFIRPKIRSFVEPKDVPENMWLKCPACEGMLFHRDIQESLNVCYHCGHHMKISIKKRLGLLFDGGKYKEIAVRDVPVDPLKFKDRKRYADRLKDSQSKTGRKDAILVAKGMIGGIETVVAAFDFSFMGGSMGAAVGEGVVKAAEEAVKGHAPLIVIPASGGARMQEGAISLMQMPRTIIAVEQVKDAGLPYIVLLTDPTTGGVSASFAMVGDVHIAEPGCMIGFAGKRVIQETIREELPDGFQTAEYLLAHGMVDMVVPRKELSETIGRLLSLLMNKTNGKAGKKGRKENGNGNKNASVDRKNEKGSASSANVVALKAKAKTVRSATKDTASLSAKKKTAADIPAPANTQDVRVAKTSQSGKKS